MYCVVPFDERRGTGSLLASIYAASFTVFAEVEQQGDEATQGKDCGEDVEGIYPGQEPKHAGGCRKWQHCHCCVTSISAIRFGLHMASS